MNRLEFSRQFLKCVYNEKLKYEANENINITFSEFIEECLMNYLNINLLDINNEKMIIDVNMYCDFDKEISKYESIIDVNIIENDIRFDKYVYVYMNPLKKLSNNIVVDISGEMFEFEFEPFYIGKGCGERMNEHLKLHENDKNFNKKKIISEIYKNDLKPIILILKKDLTNLEAHTLENILITKLNSLSNISGGKSKKSKYKSSDNKETLEFMKNNYLLNLLNSNNTTKEVSEKLNISERTLYRLKKQLNIKKINNEWIQS